MKKYSLLILLLSALCSLPAYAQRHVSQERMAEVYEEAKTPYKYGLVVAPSTNDAKIDCPTVFREGDKWYMTYVIYDGRGAKDGRGYETWLAESDNLLEWRTLGRVLPWRDGMWDANQRAGFPALVDMEWGGSYALQRYKGRAWMSYFGGTGRGYEAIEAPLSIGVAWTKDDPATAHAWESGKKPVLTHDEKDAQWWERLTHYKTMVYWDKDETLGAPFVMYYNAGGVNPETGFKGERIGIALSKNMKKWRRYEGNPVFSHEAQGTITGDAQIVKMGDVYVMFYFSAFNPSRPYKAYNTFACSYDLVTWDDWQGKDLIYPTKPYDEMFAHKSYVVKHDGVVYHFYCAVNNAEQRGIAVATSRPMGRSKVRFPEPPQKGRRTLLALDRDWTTWLVAKDGGRTEEHTVNIPHNWDDYYGYRQLTHGNLHGTAGYRKEFTLERVDPAKRYFLRFEGVGTYASIRLNGHDLGRHPIGRTVLTLDVTPYLSTANTLEVTAEHPEMIADMPWVCGGCSSEWGFSEGSQPFGIFRPVVLEVTDEVRIEPFGVHIWHDDEVKTVYIDTELKNYSAQPQTFQLVSRLNNADGVQVLRLTEEVTLAPGEMKTVHQESPIDNPKRWSTDTPYLYSLASLVKRGGKTTDEVSTPFGFRTLSWPVKRDDKDGRFYLNGQPVFINGVCEYEHQFGQSHAFSPEQVASRVKQIKNAGFNAFRDAHQPHNLEYGKYWDREGILWWTQLSAHIWYDTPEFRENFKTMLRRWVKERRNSPSVVMWGLQNESTLPRDFAEECCDIIREMDPTARTMRVITTCNGGDGTDWNVIQNWSGTYGGDMFKYDQELSQPNQLLNGEYGGWRSIDLHTEPGAAESEGVWSEEAMCHLMEVKLRLAEKARDRVCGHFQWIFSSHDNPGRRQPDEAYRKIDKVGPFNYKGLVTPWEEPLDVYYMYRSNYVSAEKDPMVYIVSHTWPDRFTGPRQATIEVYSNCDSVRLYNDAAEDAFLGYQLRGGIGTHFIWVNRDIRYNVLRAVGYYQGKAVAEDVIVLNNLPESPNFDKLYEGAKPLLKGAPGYHYLYRVNCGGDEYTDEFGQTWLTDNTTFSHSWAESFKELNPYQASQRTTHDPIRGTRDWGLFQTFRFGRHRLNYQFDVPDGKYRVELYFVEPWHGTGAPLVDCEGLRIFDVAVNGKTVVDDLDIWAEAGHDGAYKQVVEAEVTGGKLVIDFPEVKAGQAVISAIAIATDNALVTVPALPIGNDWNWEKASKEVLAKTPKEMLPEDKNTRVNVTYEAEDAKVRGSYSEKIVKKQTGIFFGKGTKNSIEWKVSTGLAQVYALRFKYMNSSGKPIPVTMKFIDSKGVVLKEDTLNFPETPEKWRMMSTTTGTFINAGHYRVVISGENLEGLAFDALDIQ